MGGDGDQVLNLGQERGGIGARWEGRKRQPKTDIGFRLIVELNQQRLSLGNQSV